MEGAHERQLAGAAEGVPADDGHDRLVDVHDVIAAARAARARSVKTACGVSAMLETAPLAGSPTVRPSETKCSGGAAAAGGAAVQAQRQRVVGVERREDARFVAGGGQLAGERLDVARDATGIGPRVRREQRDPHGAHSIRRGTPATPAAIIGAVSARRFVKYTFLKLDPAWRRLEGELARSRTSASSWPRARTSPTGTCCRPSRWWARAGTPSCCSYPRPRTSTASTSSTWCWRRAG